MTTNATASPWVCATCGAVVTDTRFRPALRCLMCGGALVKLADAPPLDYTPAKCWTTQPEGGRHE